MNEWILNETPVKTSHNFRMNHFTLQAESLINESPKFRTIKIEASDGVTLEQEVADGEKITTETLAHVKNRKFTFGTGEVAEKNIQDYANHRASFVLGNNVEQPQEDLQIVYTFDDENPVLMNDLALDVWTNSHLLLEYASDTEKACAHNGRIFIHVHENCELQGVIFNHLNGESTHVEELELKLDDHAKASIIVIDVGAKNSVTNYYANLAGEESYDELKTIYLGGKQEKKDFNYIANVYGKKAKVDIELQGALKDQARKSFKGTIDFKKGCVGAQGDENEYCFLLSEDTASLALPMLLCTEEDVCGNHSTASGKIDPKSLFYLMSRGITMQEATKLIIQARMNAILENVSESSLRQRIQQAMDLFI